MLPVRLPLTCLGLVIAMVCCGYTTALVGEPVVGPVMWGKQNFDIRAFDRPIAQVAAGWDHTVALKSDGTVVAWGSNAYGQRTVPAGLTSVERIAAGGHHTLALKADGTVVAWGRNNNWQSTVPAGLSGVIAVAAGQDHSVALKGDGSVVVWGDNTYNQRAVPANLTGVITIAAGQRHNVALKNDGTVVAWGNNQFGQSNVPAGLSGVIAVAAGLDHTVALKSDGSVVAWGYSTYTSVPADLMNVTAIAAGRDHTLALKNDGTVEAWGIDLYGQTVVPDGLTTVTAIAAAEYTSVALKSDGTVAVWGDGTFGESTSPDAFDGVSSLAAGGEHTMILRADGTVAAWGASSFGQTQPPVGLTGVNAIAAGETLSLALKNNIVMVWGGQYTFSPTLPAGPMVGIAAGRAHILGRGYNGGVSAWGASDFGQTTVPPGLAGVTAIAAGTNHSVALMNDGTLAAWGSNSNGQTTIPSGLTGVTAIAAAGNHTVALKGDGTVVAWGENLKGQTAVPAGLTGVTAIAAGKYHTVALKSDGTVAAWGGSGSYGQATVPAGLTGVTAIAAGDFHTVALVSATATPFPAPSVETMAAVVPSPSTATLSGSINPNGVITSAWFEYGLTTNYGQTTAAQPLGYGTMEVAIDADLASLDRGTTYHYRAVASNRDATAYGEDKRFTIPDFASSPVGAITKTTAVLEGVVNPDGVATTAWFEYGSTSNYGLSTTTQVLGNGTGTVSVNAPIAGLLPGNTYYYRIVVQRDGLTAYGDAMTFTTEGANLRVFAGADDTAPELLDDQALAVDFGTTPLGSAVSRRFTIKNAGTTDLAVTSLSLPAGFGHAGGAFVPLVLRPGDTHTFEVQLLANTVKGTFGGPLRLMSDDDLIPDFEVPLTGRATFGLRGSIDPSFGRSGCVITQIGTNYIASADGASALAVQSNGAIVVVGKTFGVTFNDFAVARYHADGALDRTFGIRGKVTTPIAHGDEGATSVAVQADGKIIVAGYSHNGRSDTAKSDFAVVRYNTDGSLDSSFSGDGKIKTAIGMFNDFAMDVAIQPDGKILLAGTSASVQSPGTSGAGKFALVRYLPDGTVDKTFGTSGIAVTQFAVDSQATGVALQPDGRITVAGSAGGDFAVARFTSSGALDASFANGGKLLLTNESNWESAHSVAVQPDGRIIVAGDSRTGVNLDFMLVRLNDDGSWDLDFNGSGKVITDIAATSDSLTDVAVGDDGSIVAVGKLQRPKIFTTETVVVRYNRDGALDESFGTDGKVISMAANVGDDAEAVVVQADGTCLVAGSAWDGIQSDFSLKRFTAAGSPDTQFGNPGGILKLAPSNAAGALDVAVQGDGKIVVAGKAAGGAALLRLSQAGALDRSFGSGGYVTTGDNSTAFHALTFHSDGRILAAGAFLSLYNYGDPIFRLKRYSVAGAVDVQFSGVSTIIGGEANDVAMQSDGKAIVVGEYRPRGWSSYPLIVLRCSSNGGLDTTFGTGGQVTTQIGSYNAVGRAVAVQPDGKILVAGWARSTSGRTDFAAVRYHPNGGLDTGFGSGGKLMTDLAGGNDYADGMALQPDGRIILVGTAHSGTDDDVALVRYHIDGSLDDSFGNGGKVVTAIGKGNDHAYGVVVRYDGKIVIAGSAWNGTDNDFALVSYNSDGTRDPTFANGGIAIAGDPGVEEIARSVAACPDGRLIVAGSSDDGSIQELAVASFGTDLGPGVATAAAAPVSAATANLNGAVNARGIITHAWFEYGPDAGYGQTTPLQHIGCETASKSVTAAIAGLEYNQTYHYRLVAQNEDVTAYGPDMTFIAAPDIELLAENGSTSASLQNGQTAAVDLGPVPLGTPVTTRFTIHNGGGMELNAISVTIDGTDAGDFSVSIVPDDTVAAGDNSSFEVRFAPANAGQKTAFLRVASNDPDEAPFNVGVTAAAVTAPVVIATHPLSRVVAVGRPVSFSASALGKPELSYQWRRNGSNVAGANSATFAIEAAVLGNAGSYSMTARNNAGMATSTAAEFAVVDRSDKAYQLLTGATVKLSVPVAGKGASFEWYREDGKPIDADVRFAGVATKELTIKSLQLADQGVYRCVVRSPRDVVVGGSNTISILSEPPQIVAPVTMPDAQIGQPYSFPIPIASEPERSATSYAAAGLPAGLKVNTVTGLISGKPTVSRAAPYLVTLTAINGKGRSTATTSIMVHPLPEGIAGTFVAALGIDEALNPEAQDLIGRLDVTVLPTAAFSGKAKVGAVSYAFKGVLEADTATGVGTIIINRTGIASLEIQFLIMAESPAIVGLFYEQERPLTLTLRGWRDTWNAGRNLLPILPGRHVVAAEIAGALNGNGDLPQGTSFGSAMVAKTGAVTFAGKLADGTALTSATPLGPDREMFVYTSLGSNAEWAIGTVTIAADSRQSISGSLIWLKRPQTKPAERTYKDGFGPFELAVRGGYYVPPAKGAIVLGLSDQADNAQLTFTAGGIETASIDPGIVFRVTASNAVVLPKAGSVLNPARVTLTLSPATGAFQGVFQLFDVPAGAAKGIPRSVKYQGMLVPAVVGEPAGQGYFLLPELPDITATPATTLTTSPIWSGNVRLEAR